MKRSITPKLNTLLYLPMLAAFLQGAYADESVWDKQTPALAKAGVLTVYRSPTCGCCGKWIDHMKKHGFAVKDVLSDDMQAVKRRHGVPEELASCHTAVVDGYVVEGHVPAGDIKKVLSTKAKLLGVAAPGMPAGSPGMEMPGKKDKFAVISFDKQGNADKFNEYLNY
jgi:hypothetical protein